MKTTGFAWPLVRAGAAAYTGAGPTSVSPPASSSDVSRVAIRRMDTQFPEDGAVAADERSLSAALALSRMPIGESSDDPLDGRRGQRRGRSFLRLSGSVRPDRAARTASRLRLRL